MKAKLIEAFLLMLAGGGLTSLAEYKFGYNLYESIVSLINRIRGSKPVGTPQPVPAAEAKKQ